jgi:hypothetical protein
MKISYSLFTYLLIGLLISGCSSSPTKNSEIHNQTQNSGQVTKVYFSGFSLSGDFDKSKVNFPYTYPLVTPQGDQKISILDQTAQIELKKVRNPHLEIIANDSGDIEKGQAIATAVVLDSEDVSQEKVDEFFHVVITLRGQIIAFNMKEMKMIGSYPLTAELIDTSKHKLNDQELAKLVKELHVGANQSFIKEIVKRFSKLSINTGDTRKIQIKKVTVSNSTAKLIEKSNQTNADIQNLIARNFEKYLSINQNVAILPFTKDQSVGGRFPLHFSNGDIFNLQIPSPDFTVLLELKKLIKARVGGNSAENIFGYVSVMNIKAEQPEMGSTSIDVDVRNGLSVTEPKSIRNVDDKAHFIESIIQLVKTFTLQINNPESEWLDTWVESKNDSAEQFEQFLEVINKCK